ncbi:MAG: hypothetical protein KGI08_10090 [Thaumarchaeota archaeon]|nr:hypothetical protein [Nitrososphaerota archaeon]
MTDKSNSNEWWAEQALVKSFEDKYKLNFQLDASASEQSRKCKYYISKEMDALKHQWVIDHGYWQERVDVYLNPPLNPAGTTARFVIYGYEQWKKWGMNLLMLLPAGVISRNYFKPIWDEFKNSMTTTIDIEPVRPRPKFMYMGQPVQDQARNDYITVLLKKHYI